jgi:phosphoribosylaminoimidazole-succinocarboxamide synthase
VKRVKPLPIAATVRGYLVGSGWQEYRDKGDIGGQPLPKGLRLAEQLPVPMFTPSSSATLGEHDKNINFDTVRDLLGAELATQVRDVALRLYQEAASYARKCGIIIADTKFEFGRDADGQLLLIGEALTPDSSRFWPVDDYQVGQNPPSFVKQYILDFLLISQWYLADPPELPEDVVRITAEKYQEVRARFMAGR